MQIKTENIINHIKLRIIANPVYLSVVRSAVKQVAEVIGFGSEEIDSIILATEEALTNVIRHSYGGPCCKPIIVNLGQIKDNHGKTSALEILIRDFGRQVDPATIKGRELSDIKPGGLGVHIIKSIMDETEYSTTDSEGMQLRMVKYVKKQTKEL